MARNINKIVKTISFSRFVAIAALYHGEMWDGKRQFLGQETSQGEIRDFFFSARRSFRLPLTAAISVH
jgi:hypothetical protein